MSVDTKIMDLTELVTYDTNTWLTCVDMNETDPLLQNKRIKAENFVATFQAQIDALQTEVDANTALAHPKNEDDYLDLGGPFQVAAADIKSYLRRRNPLSYSWAADQISIFNGTVWLDALVGTTIMRIGKANSWNFDNTYHIERIPVGMLIYFVGKTTTILIETIGAVTDQTNYYSVNVVVRSASGSFSFGDEILLTLENTNNQW